MSCQLARGARGGDAPPPHVYVRHEMWGIMNVSIHNSKCVPGTHVSDVVESSWPESGNGLEKPQCLHCNKIRYSKFEHATEMLKARQNYFGLKIDHSPASLGFELKILAANPFLFCIWLRNITIEFQIKNRLWMLKFQEGSHFLSKRPHCSLAMI